MLINDSSHHPCFGQLVGLFKQRTRAFVAGGNAEVGEEINGGCRHEKPWKSHGHTIKNNGTTMENHGNNDEKP